jgi:hypothetical protein
MLIGYKYQQQWEYDDDLVGGDWNFFMTCHSVGNGIIIPADELTPSFFRGVA